MLELGAPQRACKDALEVDSPEGLSREAPSELGRERRMPVSRVEAGKEHEDRRVGIVPSLQPRVEIGARPALQAEIAQDDVELMAIQDEVERLLRRPYVDHAVLGSDQPGDGGTLEVIVFDEEEAGQGHDLLNGAIRCALSLSTRLRAAQGGR
jgi:hypothetical protein